MTSFEYGPPPIRLSWRFGGDGLTTSRANPLECGGRLTSAVWTGERRGPRVKAIGGKTTASQGGARRSATQPGIIMEKEETP